MLNTIAIRNAGRPVRQTVTGEASFADRVLVVSLIAIAIVVGVNLWLGFAATPYG